MLAPPAAGDPIIKLAILAVGGQGGGVVTDWIVELAERNGWYAQSTSVPGVAQRTGATIYYIEMVPEGGGTPVLSLMPAPGDVDIVLAAELMEAGRAMQRGLVTPDRTTLIASTHRTLAVIEKVVPGSGIADPAPVLDAARQVGEALSRLRPRAAGGRERQRHLRQPFRRARRRGGAAVPAREPSRRRSRRADAARRRA